MLTAYFLSVYTKGMNSSYITALPDDWERVARVFSAMGDATRQEDSFCSSSPGRASASAALWRPWA